jgi:hypothetical protein
MARTVSLLCSLGDLTVKWDAANDPTVLPIIQKMIDSGVRFFILKKSKQVEVSKITQPADARKIVIPDQSLQSPCASGLLTIGGLMLSTEETTGEVARTAEQVAENDTVATQPAVGG